MGIFDTLPSGTISEQCIPLAQARRQRIVQVPTQRPGPRQSWWGVLTPRGGKTAGRHVHHSNLAAPPMTTHTCSLQLERTDNGVGAATRCSSFFFYFSISLSPEHTQEIRKLRVHTLTKEGEQWLCQWHYPLVSQTTLFIFPTDHFFIHLFSLNRKYMHRHARVKPHLLDHVLTPWSAPYFS
jgi:hypothetical protein